MNAEDIVRRLAEISSEDIIEHHPSVGAVEWVQCKLCHRQDRKHAEDCPWFMARLWSVIPPDVVRAQEAARLAERFDSTIRDDGPTITMHWDKPVPPGQRAVIRFEDGREWPILWTNPDDREDVNGP